MPVSAVDVVLRVASACVGSCESPPASNAGPFVERVLASVGLPKGNPWCAAWVYDVGIKALGKGWPLPKTGGCAVLGEDAQRRGLLSDTPHVGDVFLIFHSELGRFAHTGFVTEVNGDGGCGTLEGNTSGAGSREGWLVAARRRTFGPKDRFIHWQPQATL